MNTKKIDEALFDCYRQLFAKSTPPADFDQLIENAELNNNGQKVIPFNDYEIDENLFETILLDVIKKHKVPKGLIQPFKTTIYLGCSPKFKR